MAFATAAVLLAFAVGCDDKKEEQPAIGLKMSVNPAEFEFNDRHETGDVKVSVEEAAEWSFSVSGDENGSWVNIERTDDGLQISVEPLLGEMSRYARIDIKAAKGRYSRTLPVEVRQYDDNNIPKNGPIHFYDETFEQKMLELCDDNANGKVSPAEAEKVKKIECSGCGIVSIAGIRYFRNITSADFSNNSLKVIDLRYNAKLTKLDLRNNPLTEVVLGQNQEIEDLQIDDASVIVRRN